MDVSNEIQETLGRSYGVPDDVDEEELMGGKISSCTFEYYSENMFDVYLTLLLYQSLMLWKRTWSLKKVFLHTYNLTRNQIWIQSLTCHQHQWDTRQCQLVELILRYSSIRPEN